jgi:hypothetical protein
MSVSPRSRRVLVAMVVTAVPIAWGVETVLRLAFFPAHFEELRVMLQPVMSTVARSMVLLTLLLVWPTWALMRWIVRRRLRGLPGRRPDLRAGVRLVAFLLASSLLLLPGVLATLAFMLGAAVRPVAAVVVAGTLGLAGLGVVTLRDCAREGPTGPEKSLDDPGTAP